MKVKDDRERKDNEIEKLKKGKTQEDVWRKETME